MTAPAAVHPPWGVRWAIAALASAVALFGISVIVGWHAHLLVLVQLRPTLAPMQYNTAVCFILAGAALVAWLPGRGRLATPILGGLVALTGGVTLAEYLCQRDLGIDQLLFHPYIVERVTHLGRMSPVSSSCFILVGLALIVICGNAGRWRFPLVGALASVVGSICMMAIFGYIFNLPGTYGWGQLTRIALHTAMGFTLLGSSLFILAWHAGRREGERTPRWLPVPLALSVFTATLVLYFALDRKQDEQIAQTVRNGAESVKSQLLLRLDGRMRSLVRMAENWEFSGQPSQAAWEADATNYTRDLPDVDALEWIDATSRIRWIAPLKGNEGKLNMNILDEPRRRAAADQARAEHKPVLTRAVTLFHGGLGFAIYVPVGTGDRFDGWIAVTLKAQPLFERYFPPAVAPGEALRFSEGGHLLSERTAGAPPGKENWVVEEKIELPGTAWNIRVWPTPELAARLDDPLPEIVLFSGALGAVLLGAICALAQRSSRLATETSRANAALRAALDQVKTLEGLLPICACCKRVRDDTGCWNQIESYVARRTRASFSHGYCPECAAKAFTEFGLEVPEQVKDELAEGRFE